VISSVESFISYFEGIRRRTMRYVRAVPAGSLDWSPREGEFSCADIIRHIAATESMFVGAVAEGRWRYGGHTGASAEEDAAAIATLETVHERAMNTLRLLDDEVLSQPRPTLDGPATKAWRLLMAMAEHEVHHRSQLAVYMMLMGIEPPQIYGLGVEDVIARATG
jgi:uncharacterized damage-inducible protein DinB